MKTFYSILTTLSISIISSVGLTNHLVAQKNEMNHEVLEIHSELLNEGRILRISVPDNYEKTQDRYPVLYRLDGTATFFTESVHNIKNLYSVGEIPEMIVVGIENTDRWRDMLPVKLERHPTAGGASRFFKFLKQEVIRFVDDNYRTNPVRILFGQSNSALFTIYAMTENANIFTGIIASSPSVGHCKDYIFDKMESFLNTHSESDRYLFISNGGRDTAVRLMAPIPEFIDRFKEKRQESIIWEYKYYENEGHCPTPTLRDGLIWFFQHMQTPTIGYLNQQPPGLTPKRFAPGLISTKEFSETGCTFTPDGKELYFTRSGGNLDSPTIFVSRFQDNKWTPPEKAPFTGFGPHVSPDGEKIFVSKHGTNEENQRTTELWFAIRKENRWTGLQYHGLGNRPSMSNSFNLYYVDRSNEEDRGVIVVQHFIDGKYSKSNIIGGGINTPHYEAHPCIARDESYIIFDSNRPGGYGEGDLYICFRNKDGTWGNAINLGSTINTEGYEAYSSISPDRKYLFYSSNNDGNFDLYWVDLNIIENIRR